MFLKLIPTITASAHCDVPCGLYDPTAAKMAAATVLKMVRNLKAISCADLEQVREHTHNHNDITRRVLVKEEHATKCKQELWTLWSDYFKPEHLEKYPDLHTKFWQATKLCSANKQDVSEEKALQLIAAVDEIAQIFYATKNDEARFESYKNVTDKLV